MRKIITSFGLALVLIAGSVLSVSAEEQTEDTSTVETNPEVLAQDAKRVEDVKKIYSKYAKEIGAMKEAALQKAGVTSVKDLSGQSQRAISQAEEKMEENMFRAIDNAMAKNGSKKINNENQDEEVVAEEPTVGVASLSGHITLNRSLYKNSDGSYTYYGYWNWADGYWDSFADTTDHLAVRSTKDITTRISASIYSWDNQGFDRHSSVGTRTWEPDGVIYNVHDYLGYGWGGSMPLYYTDNGYGVFTFKVPTGSEIYSHFEHNWKQYSWSATGTIDGFHLSNSSFIIDYGLKNYTWQRVGNPALTW